MKHAVPGCGSFKKSVILVIKLYFNNNTILPECERHHMTSVNDLDPQVV